jgi:hypothetical protein
MNADLLEKLEAWKDYVNWKKHVEEEKRIRDDPDTFNSYKRAKIAAKVLLTDFEEEAEESVIIIFETDKGHFKIDAISNHNEFELHRDEYDPEDVQALVFFQENEPFIKQMR